MEKIVLPEDFSIDMYGVRARFVNEGDADFIISLRCDTELSKYVHDTPSDIESQQKWIRGYKEREKDGMEYYFIFSKDGKPYGLNRIYCLDWKKRLFTTGSWFCKKDTPVADMVASSLIPRVLAFERFGLTLEYGWDGVHKDNLKVIKFDELVGMKRCGEFLDVKGTYYSYTLINADFQKAKDKLEKMLYRLK